MRIVNLLFALVLIAALVIALDPQARSRAMETVRDWEPTLRQLDDRIVVNVPEAGDRDLTPTPLSTATPIFGEQEQIPVTGDEDSSDEPIVQINWDALGDTLREFWVRLTEIRIDMNPKDNK